MDIYLHDLQDLPNVALKQPGYVTDTAPVFGTVLIRAVPTIYCTALMTYNTALAISASPSAAGLQLHAHTAMGVLTL